MLIFLKNIFLQTKTYLYFGATIGSCNPNPCLNGGYCGESPEETFSCQCQQNCNGKFCENCEDGKTAIINLCVVYTRFYSQHIISLVKYNQSFPFLIIQYYDLAQFPFERYPVLAFFSDGPMFPKVYLNADKSISSLKAFLNEQMGRTPISKRQVLVSVQSGPHNFVVYFVSVKICHLSFFYYMTNIYFYYRTKLPY